MIKTSDIKSLKPSEAGIFQNLYFFYNKTRKRIKNVEQKLVNIETQNFKKSIKKYVQWMGDANLSAQLSGVDFAVKEVKYLSYCRIKYQIEAEGKHKQEKRIAGEGCIPETGYSIWHLNRDIHKKTFKALCSYLQEVVIQNKDVLMLTDVNNYYCHLLHQFQGNTFEVT